MSDFVEPGRWVDEQGVIRYAWPPEGRFADLWQRITAITSEEERLVLIPLLSHEMTENSTLVSYTDENGDWQDIEPDWSAPPRWMDGLG